MSYKLVCCDIDGTLIDWDGNIPSENRRAIEELDKRGILFVICTGRMHRCAELVSRLLDLHSYTISSCGMVVESPLKGDFMKNQKLDPDVVEKIITLPENLNIYAKNFQYREGMITTSCANNYEYDIYSALNERVKKIGASEEDLTEFVENKSGQLAHTFRKSFNKITLWMEDVDSTKKVYDYIQRNIPELECASGMPTNLELTPKGLSKWNGIETIMQRHGIKPEEVVCIGDSMNDIDMIRHAGLGVAMGNASDEVKKAADLVTDTNENAGVAKVIFERVLE